jgi:Tfp pilus assembly protein PilF
VVTQWVFIYPKFYANPYIDIKKLTKINMNPQIGFLLNKTLEALRALNLETAELYLKQAYKLQPKNPHTLRLFGVLLAQKEQYLEAKDYFIY